MGRGQVRRVAVPPHEAGRQAAVASQAGGRAPGEEPGLLDALRRECPDLPSYALCAHLVPDPRGRRGQVEHGAGRPRVARRPQGHRLARRHDHRSLYGLRHGILSHALARTQRADPLQGHPPPAPRAPAGAGVRLCARRDHREPGVRQPLAHGLRLVPAQRVHPRRAQRAQHPPDHPHPLGGLFVRAPRVRGPLGSVPRQPALHLHDARSRAQGLCCRPRTPPHFAALQLRAAEQVLGPGVGHRQVSIAGSLQNRGRAGGEGEGGLRLGRMHSESE